LNECKENISNKQQWYNNRKNLEKQFELALLEFQDYILSKEIKIIIKSIFLENKNFIKLIQNYYNKALPVTSLDTFTSEVLEEIISYSPLKLISDKNIYNIINDFYYNIEFSDIINDEQFFYYITSAETANFPLENIPIFYYFCFIRTFHYNLIQKDEEIGVYKNEIYYILNPHGDLTNSEEYLKPILKDKFEGICGKEPKEIISTKLNEIKFLIYAGHSNGSNCIDTNFIKKNQINCITLLFGCSSVKLSNIYGKKNEPIDLISYYSYNKWY